MEAEKHHPLRGPKMDFPKRLICRPKYPATRPLGLCMLRGYVVGVVRCNISRYGID